MYSYSASVVSQGQEMIPLLEDSARGLERGHPDDWTRLFNHLETVVGGGIQLMDQEILEESIRSWGLNQEIHDLVVNDVGLLLAVAADSFSYVVQTFNYNHPNCQHPDSLNACMRTLIVIAKRLESTSQDAFISKVGHLYLTSDGQLVQQGYIEKKCHSCWFRQCCHETWLPRPLQASEIQEIEAFMQSEQSRGALELVIPKLEDISVELKEPVVISEFTLRPGRLDSSEETKDAYKHWWVNGGIQTKAVSTHANQQTTLQDHLYQFVNNDIENEEVFKKHDDALLSTIQMSINSAPRNLRRFSMTFQEQHLSILDNLLSPCFKKANVSETATEIFQRARSGRSEMPFSLECQSITQTQMIENLPSQSSQNFNKTSILTSNSWLLLSPRQNMQDGSHLLDTIFIYHDIETTTHDCNKKTPFHSETTLESTEEGSILRWSIPQDEGYFSNVHYIIQWPVYTKEQNKILMDILRYASATTYLKDPIHREIDEPESGGGVGDSLSAIGKGLGDIGEGWSKFSDAFANKASETVTREICLGFSRYEHTAKAFYAQGIAQENFPKIVDAVLNIAKVRTSDIEDIREALIVLEFSSNITWIGESVSYTSEDGFHRYFYLYKYANEITGKIDIIFSFVSSTFTIAPDILTVQRKTVKWIGLSRSEDVVFRNIPHTISAIDTVLLNTYFEVVLYRQVAIVTGLSIPDYPDMGPVCRR
ncbi:hypothetical protein BGZ76_004437 [Entomortierella beljakovae]|nr:hypothetical protein BGZ76_004437 [Entomortierella beljakovae]